MTDIIVTTPKNKMDDAAMEAFVCRAAGGGYYFRRFSTRVKIEPGEKVIYVEDGFIRGYALVDHFLELEKSMVCEATGQEYQAGYFLFILAQSWKWIEPISMTGFQGFRYSKLKPDQLKIIGDWQDPKPPLKFLCNVCKETFTKGFEVRHRFCFGAEFTFSYTKTGKTK